MNQILAWLASFILGLGVVWKFVGMYKSKVRKALLVCDNVLSLINTILNATEDKKITKQEIEDIMLKVTKLKITLEG